LTGGRRNHRRQLVGGAERERGRDDSVLGELSEHGPDCLVADTELSGQGAQTLGTGEREYQCFLVTCQLASAGAIARR
jgi:hypothetical protein